MLIRLSVLLLALAGNAFAETAFRLDGIIVGVSDGDTVTLLEPTTKTQHRIRLANIDAPESRQDFGQQSKHSLSNMVYRKRVVASCKERDRYSRAVCTIYLNGFDINAEMVRIGQAWVYRAYTPRHSPLYRLEQEARAARIGLWQHNSPTPPWEWRRTK